MTGLEKIIEDIRAESKAEQDKVLNKAEAAAAEQKQKAEAEALSRCAKIRQEYERKIADEEARVQSAADLERRRGILTAKQELISEVTEEAKKRIRALPADQYFDLVLKMASKAAHPGEEGVIRFSAADLERLPEDFSWKLSASLPEGTSLSVSDQAAEIADGFLLDYSGVEENGSFDAVFAEKKEELQDRIHRILF